MSERNRPPADGDPGRSAGSAVRWNLLAVIGRQVFQFVAAVVLGRILGPESYGVISAATIYVTLSTLILDQGLAAALIQRPGLSRAAPGAAATVNLVSGALLGLLTVAVAPWVAAFFSVDELTPILRWLGLGLVIKAAAIAPRAMHSRSMTFRPIAVADVAGAAVGTGFGVAAAVAGAGPSAMVFQVLGTDLVIAVVLLASWRGPRPNLRFREAAELLPYGMRVLATNAIAYFSRNVDNILVGRVLDMVALSYYAMAYRVLVIPVQMLGQTVSRVMFPMFSALVRRGDDLSSALVRATQLLAFAAVPSMALVAVAAREVVEVALGRAWLPGAPLLTVLALAGARETVFYLTAPLMKATGQVRLALRYEVLATAVQVGGIVIGLQFGVFWVGVGYAVAGLLLSPVLLAIQRRLTGVRIRHQLAVMAPPLHAAGWGTAGYAAVSLTSLGPLATLVLGSLAYLALALAVLALVHRSSSRQALAMIKDVLRPGGRGGGGPGADPGPQEEERP